MRQRERQGCEGERVREREGEAVREGRERQGCEAEREAGL